MLDERVAREMLPATPPQTPLRLGSQTTMAASCGQTSTIAEAKVTPGMSESTEALIRRMFTVIDGRRWSELSQFYKPNLVYERPGYEPLMGLAALEHFYRQVRIVAAGEHRIERVVTAASMAIVIGRFIGAANDGRMLDERFADMYELCDDRIARRTTYFFRAAI